MGINIEPNLCHLLVLISPFKYVDVIDRLNQQQMKNNCWPRTKKRDASVQGEHIFGANVTLSPLNCSPDLHIFR